MPPIISLTGRRRPGHSPHRWLQKERVRRAQELLETTGLCLEQIAPQAGFSVPQPLRLHFKRIVGTPPSAYRAPSPLPTTEPDSVKGLGLCYGWLRLAVEK